MQKSPVSHPQRILVVDDNRDAADSLSMLLRLRGHDVHTTYDGRTAVTMAAQLRPEVVLLDIGLPELNGHEVAREIRAQPHGASVLLIALSGWGRETDRLDSRDAGFDHHLVKPMEFDVLEQLLASRENKTVGE